MVNDASIYSANEYFEKYISGSGISLENYEKALESRSNSFFYMIPDVQINNEFVFCRPIIAGGKNEALIMMTVDGEKLIDSVIETDRKNEYPFAVYDKYGNCFLKSGHIDDKVAEFGKEQKTSGVYRYKNNTLLIHKSSQTGYRYIFSLANNVYTGGSSGLAVIFLELLIIILLISTFIAKRRTEKINKRFLDFKNENMLLSNQLAGYMKDVRKNNMLKVLQNHFDPLGKPAKYDFRFKHKESRVMIMYIIAPEEYVFADYDSNNQRLDEFNNELVENLSKSSYICEFANAEERLYVYVINYPKNTDFETAEKIFGDTMANYNIQGYVGIGNPVFSTDKISQSYEDALNAVSFAKNSNSAEAVKYSDIKTEKENIRYSSEKEEKLIRAIKRGMEDVTENIFAEIYKDNSNEKTGSLPQRLIFDIISTIYVAVEETEENREDKLQKYDRICKHIIRMNTPEAFEILKEVAIDLAKHNKNASKQSGLREKMLDYTEKMYLNQDFCLQMLADEMNMNYYNVSRLFTEYVGESFISYVTSKRLEKASEYLSDTNMPIEDIAFKVGFIRSSSFINVFKKYYGLTPGKYRQNYRKED